MPTVAYALLTDENGQGLVEYALIVGLVALVAVSSLALFGRRLNNSFNNSSQVITSLS